jgi:hypothetical protein
MIGCEQHGCIVNIEYKYETASIANFHIFLTFNNFIVSILSKIALELV